MLNKKIVEAAEFVRAAVDASRMQGLAVAKRRRSGYHSEPEDLQALIDANTFLLTKREYEALPLYSLYLPTGPCLGFVYRRTEANRPWVFVVQPDPENPGMYALHVPKRVEWRDD
jgi:hypothetical protein